MSKFTEMLKQRYDSVELFSENLTKVELNGKWGFVDNSGNEVVGPRYEDIFDFRGGRALVKLNNKTGWLRII